MKEPKVSAILKILDIDPNSVSQQTVDFMNTECMIYESTEDGLHIYAMFEDSKELPEAIIEPVKSEITYIIALTQLYDTDFIRFV